ncbi:bifunctional 1-(5-phosphoribosyl)-5-((5-phosphoribosylamino)methylideneamino)imidazole-4-carboxamide isomerase/phosphoribosylanthranilate isomerase PriA [Corynebacterium pelargi]|uniref:1-(5-phosphoribosyl)-5-[(5-phosphoribosylamino)methylideneamino] imidazole-4-carboxamide isomerase n=1 Tax=Corynebacterium pelargi TaxID=1471400 RepID=A0A410W806_9CORY|nr:bifunctional 1-(5-phosphoribosyl)-5-((5-phosphoribosylamino)methylideneamino)imidazole-4-carboxamide isomerase/phosphoribosylanthranilate isomerase PriA [Corynebacterium pelargi]QAU52079.1 1-(5-phosphoribosyl)-5-[(5-phosphoribosylamino)methylideneamino] imidazole-4-carboxamide isomerase [Corynebacterium pelargi]GGG70287.1 1-(5-phosphoribosyl)-5-[(5-phosphoribosylamino) methylideneamino] imidazole-4-carboxamide isomerase [Corynebacterium pelargi]
MTFTLLPAVDVVNGQAVRLNQGEAGTEQSYGSPLESALRWQEAGASWLHFVDLDAAFGRGSNHEMMAQVVEKLDLQVELTGGIRDDESLERALGTGAQRVNIGTAALEKPEWIADVLARYGDKVAVDLAVKLIDGQWRTRGKGWVSDGGDLWEVLERLDAAGCQRFVVTDVSKDGMMSGPNVDLLRDVAAATDAKIVASGGISTLDDVLELAKYEEEGIDSAIIGKALYEGTIDLREALQAL